MDGISGLNCYIRASGGWRQPLIPSVALGSSDCLPTMFSAQFAGSRECSQPDPQPSRGATYHNWFLLASLPRVLLVWPPSRLPVVVRPCRLATRDSRCPAYRAQTLDQDRLLCFVRCGLGHGHPVLRPILPPRPPIMSPRPRSRKPTTARSSYLWGTTCPVASTPLNGAAIVIEGHGSYLRFCREDPTILFRSGIGGCCPERRSQTEPYAYRALDVTSGLRLAPQKNCLNSCSLPFFGRRLSHTMPPSPTPSSPAPERSMPALASSLQLVDQALDHDRPICQNAGSRASRPNGGEQLGMVLGAAGREHVEIALDEASSAFS